MSSSDDTIPMVSIPLAEYKFLKDRSEKLSALECSGVDKWSGYEKAMELYGTLDVWDIKFKCTIRY